ncbi:MAG TPA: hypothetical protein VF518_11200, partial [Polyangia bacterium]
MDEVATREGGEVLDVDITANRGDAMSHRGMAREVAAKLGQPLVAMDPSPVVEGKAVVEVRLDSPACPIYSTAVLVLGAGDTP